jgi:hypothetical protein
MNDAASPSLIARPYLNVPRRLASAMFVCGAVATIVLFLIFPRAAAHGWLIAFNLFSQIALGSLALLLIDSLTGTSWGRAFGGVLRGFLFGIPLAALFLIPIAINLREIYSWAASPEKLPQDVIRIYLNPGAFWLRSIIAFAGWILFAALLVRGKIARLTAALGLLFFGVSSYVIGYDWLLSASAPFNSSSFSAQMAIQAMLAALASAALFAPSTEDTRAKPDLGGFIIAGALAVFYFELMSFIVEWYGDLPDQAEWYLDRAGSWIYAAVLATIFGAALPIVSLLWGSVRKSGTGLLLVGCSVLFGIAVHIVWLLAPIAQPLTWLCALSSSLAMIGAFVAAQRLGEGLVAQRSTGYV